MISLLTLLFPHSPDMILKDIELENTTLLLSIESTKIAVACPACAVNSSKVHSRYIRQPADLPWMEYAVRLHLEVRRFFCQNESCPRKTFAELFPHLVQAYARRTLRQTHLLEELAFALGGKPGAVSQKRLAALPVVRRSYVFCAARHFLHLLRLEFLELTSGRGGKAGPMARFS
jgi:transposase